MKQWKINFLIGFLALVLGLMGNTLSVQAEIDGVFEDNPRITFTDDGYAWTIKEALPADIAYTYTMLDEDPSTWPSYWEILNTRVDVGEKSNAEVKGVGQHYYKYKRLGEVPVWYWQVEWPPGSCIHECEEVEWHGVTNTPNGVRCHAAYYSGWMPYCADCGERLSGNYIWATQEAIRDVDVIDVDYGYYYQCPACQHLDIAVDEIGHDCKKVSYNKYKVEYNRNYTGTQEMEPSYHMYNNATQYNGKTVSYSKYLNLNTYTRTGYEFVGWSTVLTEQLKEPQQRSVTLEYLRETFGDAGITFFEDGAEIYNLTDKDVNEDPHGGTVTLYAIWRVAESTLNIDPNGGRYGNSLDVVPIERGYGYVYDIEMDRLIPPAGYKVKFVLDGGSFTGSIIPTLKENGVPYLTTSKAFSYWSQSSPFNGAYRKVQVNGEDVHKYAFLGADGSVDTLTAMYKDVGITLPYATKTGSSFGGWYVDKDTFVNRLGGGGEEVTPTGEITLYARWVTLELESDPNYIDNNKKGAADLTWTQQDTANKTYLLYRSDDGQNFKLLSGETAEVEAGAGVKQVFTYAGNLTREYTIPATGTYTIAAYGAAGMDWGSQPGGKGGMSEGRFSLTKGDKLKIIVGGQEGKLSGGKGTLYGYGGDASSVTLAKTGEYLVVGAGGGGAALDRAGQPGGLATSLLPASDPNSWKGQSGLAGGGGGIPAGTAGGHKESCYQMVDLGYTLVKRTDGIIADNPSAQTMDDWLITYGNSAYVDRDRIEKGGFDFVTVNTYDRGYISSDLLGIYGHSVSDDAQIVLRYGRVGNGSAEAYAPNLTGYGSSYIPTRGNTKVTIDVLADSRHMEGVGALDMEKTWLQVCDQNGNRLKTIFAKDIERETNSWVEIQSSDTDDSMVLVEEGKEKMARFVETITLPEGTTSIYFDASVGQMDADSWLGIHVNEVSFSGGTEKVLSCPTNPGGFTCIPAYGGNSVIGPNALSYKQEAGVQSGTGQVIISMGEIGYTDEMTKTGVPAPDLVAPDKIDEGTVTKKGCGVGMAEVSFDVPKDNGTQYWFKVESYDSETLDYQLTSNVVTETLTTQVKGYYYKLNQVSNTDVGTNIASAAYMARKKGNGMAVDAPVLAPAEGEKTTVQVDMNGKAFVYLHIAPVDMAGNVGETIHILIEEIDCSLETSQINVTDVVSGKDYGTVYPKATNTYYVRADGESPFVLSYDSYLNGNARVAYQIDYQIFKSEIVGNGKTQQYISRLPYSPASYLNNNYQHTISGSSITRMATGENILSYGGYVSAYRKNKLTANRFVSAFTMPASLHGETIKVVPVAGATGDNKITYSEWNNDVNNAVTLIPDGVAPVISGTDVLAALDGVNRTSDIPLFITATDDLSGYKSMTMTVLNRDTNQKKEYDAGPGGSISVTLLVGDEFFSGNLMITIAATDNVGNTRVEEYGATELSIDGYFINNLLTIDNTFSRGELAVLAVDTYGYPQKMTVTIPAAILPGNDHIKTTYNYLYPEYMEDERLFFTIPADCPVGTYDFLLTGYKDGLVVQKTVTIAVTDDPVPISEVKVRIR